MSQKTFADLGVSEVVVNKLAARGYTEPFAIQELVIQDAMQGKDILAKSPTGSGKTLAFGVPMVHLAEATDPRPSVLILSPTRELASQIVEETREIAHARALKIKAVYGGVGIQQQARDAAKSHIIVATPGRLEDLIARGAITLKNVKLLILDEADRMLDMGFKPCVDRIVKQCRNDRQTLFFSATLDGEAGRIAERYTNNPRRHEHRPAVETKADIEHRFISVGSDNRIDRLISELEDNCYRAIVFVRTKRGADRLVKRLSASGVDAVAMHGDKSQKQREHALRRFELGKVQALVATDVAARGIDVDDVSHVINFDPPEDREGYVHRVGRTGRAGRKGIGITFVGEGQAGEVGKIAADLDLHTEFGASGLHFTATGPMRRKQGGGSSRNTRNRPQNGSRGRPGGSSRSSSSKSSGGSGSAKGGSGNRGGNGGSGNGASSSAKPKSFKSRSRQRAGR